MLTGSGLEYEVGDALGVVPTNCPDFVREILDAAGLDGEEAVKAPDGNEMPLRLALLQKFDLKPFLTDLPQKAASASEFVAPLRKLQPRLYSISSSPKAHPGEVHLTVAVVRYELNGRARKGVCSTFFADRVGPDTKVPVFVHKSPSFKLPADGSKPIIMVGPGTGVAPFRAFLEERRAVAATGRNWLFFGDQKAACDFLYREELEAMQGDGFLTRLDTAFSRDQAQKIYVQDRMMENAGEIWSWLQEGDPFMSAAMPSAWLRTLMRRCTRLPRLRALSPRSRRRNMSSSSNPKRDTCVMCTRQRRGGGFSRARLFAKEACQPFEKR